VDITSFYFNVPRIEIRGYNIVRPDGTKKLPLPFPRIKSQRRTVPWLQHCSISTYHGLKSVAIISFVPMGLKNYLSRFHGLNRNGEPFRGYNIVRPDGIFWIFYFTY
jgi:hypothetical protein